MDKSIDAYYFVIIAFGLFNLFMMLDSWIWGFCDAWKHKKEMKNND